MQNVHNADYTRLSDEVTVLKNPHKGFYYHYIDNGFQRPTYRNGLKSREELLSFPGMNHLYIRFDWSDVEREKGVYDWSLVDQVMEQWPEMKFSFRVCTYETGTYNVRPAVPEWLTKIEGVGVPFTSYYNEDLSLWLGDSKGDAHYTPAPGEKVVAREFFEPNYDHPVYLEALESFMKAFGQRYNGDPRIEYIDVGTFGRWGEGHSQTTPYNLEVLKTHVDLHLKYFPDTQIILNDDFIRHLAENDVPGSKLLENYCLYHGIGMRDDGICVEQFCPKNRMSTMEQPEMVHRFSEYAPVDIELQHYHLVSDEFMAGGLRYLESLRDSGATYTGFHGFAGPWLEKYAAMTDYLANRLGYWYFIQGARFMDANSGQKSLLELNIANKGFARAYHRYELRITARSGDQVFLLNKESPDNRHWRAGESYWETVALDFIGVPAGQYRLCVGMYNDEEPIKLAILSKYMTEDGAYALDTIQVNP